MDMFKTREGLSYDRPMTGPVIRLRSTVPVGDWYGHRPLGAGTLSFQDSKWSWCVEEGGTLQDKKFARGETFSEVVSGYYSHLEPDPGFEGHQLCHYCGADNGPNGEYRVGHDCVACGAN